MKFIAEVALPEQCSELSVCGEKTLLFSASEK
jgi:hypothetical protein